MKVRRAASMPHMRDIEAHHGLDHGYCYRCGQPARCERAHVVDRSAGGANAVENLVPLCYPCHAQMPPFAADEEPYAWAWLNADAVTYFRWRFTQIDSARRAIAKIPEDITVDDLPASLFDLLLCSWPGANGEFADLSDRRPNRTEGRAA